MGLQYKEMPSFLNSTFSIISLISVIAYVALCCYMKELSSLKELVMFLMGAYGMKKGIDITNKKENQK